MVIIGFTGTREGMSSNQKDRLYDIIRDLQAYQLCHGDCVGADEEACKIARQLNMKICCHPPDNDKLRAYVSSDTMNEPLPYIERNHAIVSHCDILIAAPKESNEVLRSGTWATVRYARKHKKSIILLAR